MKKITICVVMAMLCLNFKAICQKKSSENPVLNIGDNLPDEIWGLPISVTNHPNNRDFVTLNEFKGKLIILDFWATWCGACISSFPKIARLNKEFENRVIILPVTRETRRTVSTFSAKNSLLENIKLLSIVNDREFETIFPHTMIPHEVWILPSGMIGAITDGSQLNSENIQRLLYGDTVGLNLKKDVMNFNKEKPLLIKDNGAEESYFLKRSILTKYINGIPSFIGFPKPNNNVKGAIRLFATNVNILNLYSLAFPELASLPSNRVIFNVKDLSKFKSNNLHQTEWDKANLFCYELIAPSSTSDISKIISTDLDVLFSLHGRMESKLTKCIILKSVSTDKIRPKSHQKTQKLSSWVFKFNTKPCNQTLIDESGFGGLDIPLELGNPLEPTTVAFLKIYGIDVLEEVRPIDLFVLTDL